jgi:cardiolipin synthase
MNQKSLKRSRFLKFLFVSGGLVILILAGVVQFIFNPLGLGPEPETVLSSDFFNGPASDLSELELLVDGGEAFDRIFAAIDSAESLIYVQTYIWKDDATGKQVVTGLKAAAGRGVSVTVSKDILGTFFEIGDILKGNPSPVFTSEGLKDYKNIKVNLDLFADTDHSKYFIVDQRLVVFGGMNIADEYHHIWHDYMALIRSDHWTQAFKDKVLKGSPWPKPSPFIVTVNDHHRTEIRTALIEMIDNAADSIVIEHAYFSDNKVIAAVKRAVARRVKVAIILPEKPDTHLYANMATINKLLASEPQSCIMVYLYPKMSHAKVVLADGKIAAIGSANLTPRSMLTSKEVTLFVHGRRDDSFILKLHDQLVEDKNKSKPVSKPFDLSFTDRLKALVGKYVW